MWKPLVAVGFFSTDVASIRVGAARKLRALETLDMLNDIFSDRYDHRTFSTSNPERYRRFMMQISRMITEQLFPKTGSIAIISKGRKLLEKVHDDLCMELGVHSLNNNLAYMSYDIHTTTNLYLRENIKQASDVDAFFKDRLSFIELSFREFEKWIKRNNGIADVELKNSVFQSEDWQLITEASVARNQKLEENIHELKERLRMAGLPLTYSNGYIQLSDDELISDTIKQPFWKVMADPKWGNAEHDMLTAIDLRDAMQPGAASYAAKALERVIKIISHDKGWNTGNEKGAASYIDNLVSQNNGRFIAVWESTILKTFFTEVRNKLQHGAGVGPLLVLTKQQDDWAIETCMSWIRSLISRL